MKEIIKGDRRLPVRILRKNNKNTYVRVRHDHVEITTHHHTKLEGIEAYLLDRFDALEVKIQKRQSEETKETIQLWGKTYSLLIHLGRFRYELIDDCVIAHYPKQDEGALKKAIYMDQLKKKMTYMDDVQDHLNQLGFKRATYRFRYLKSKYGSYHRLKNEITLNTYLARLDARFLTYVLYHEYVHQKEFNHSKAFYWLLATLMPDYKTYQKHLKNIAIH